MRTQSRYALPEDLARHGCRAETLKGISVEAQQAALDLASTLADSYFGSRYTADAFPLTVGEDVKRAVCQIAAYDLLAVKGFNPTAGADVNLRLRYEDAVKWLKEVGKQEAHADITPSASQTPTGDAPRVITSPRQGWTTPCRGAGDFWNRRG